MTGSLVEAVRGGDRRALARAITLVESTRDDHRAEAAEVLAAVLPATGGAVRLGVSGPPGVGKSTFVETLGQRLTGAGHRLAVLAVDPSSTRSGGSILGDKTRMEQLARDPQAFVRPSPAGTIAGGVARRTREALLLCEAAGFDVVFVETVGVGQSEVAVAEMVDTFALLANPGGGDELQGIKRGVMELADLVVVTKADGELLGPARTAQADYRHALHLLRPRLTGWSPPVLAASARTGEGVDEMWQTVLGHRQALEAGGALAALRQAQAKAWLWEEVRAGLLERLRGDEKVAKLVPDFERRVAEGELAPPQAAAQLLAAHRGSRPKAGSRVDRPSGGRSRPRRPSPGGPGAG